MRLLILFSILLLSCNKTTIPKDVLPPEKMEKVLFDVIRADELVDFSMLTDTSYNKFSRRTALYDSIFQLHVITKDQFKKSYSYYQNRPDLLKVMFDTLYARTDTTGKKQIVKPVLDSVAKKY